MTVSRVLQGRKNQVSEETYKRVLAVLHDLNYVPVRPVTQNRHVETNAIGLVPYHQNPSRNPIDSQTFEGFCDNASHHGYDLFIMLRGEAEWMANREELRFLDRRCDGFVFISPGLGEWQAALDSLVQHNIPAVVCYRRDVPEGVAWVDPDNASIVRLAMECLERHGHRDIALFSGPHPLSNRHEVLANMTGPRANYDDRERINLFSERMAQLGEADPASRIVQILDSKWVVQEQDIDALLELQPTAVFCINDHLALQLLDHLERRGIDVPGQISVVGVDDQMASRARGLTTIAFGYDEVGRHCVEAWIALKNGTPAAEACREVPVKLVERSSVGPVRSGPIISGKTLRGRGEKRTAHESV